MPRVKRILSSALLAIGVLLVFAGFTASLGFTPVGMVASLAAIAALLYAGAAWQDSSPRPPGAASLPQPFLVFDLDRRIVTGPATGQPLGSQFPEAIRAEIERRGAAALAGASERFQCLHEGRAIALHVYPVRRADGTIVYGILLPAEPAAAAATASSLPPEAR